MDNLNAGRFLSAVFAGLLDTQIKNRLALPCNWKWKSKHPCPGCGKSIVAQPTALCKLCRMASKRVPVACSWCGTLFPKLASQLIGQTSKKDYQHFFCNRSCLGHWAAVTRGFIAHPENAKFGGHHCKWDWGRVQALALERFWGARRIGKQLGIPVSSVDHILHELRKAGRLAPRFDSSHDRN